MMGGAMRVPVVAIVRRRVCCGDASFGGRVRRR